MHRMKISRSQESGKKVNKVGKKQNKTKQKQ